MSKSHLSNNVITVIVHVFIAIIMACIISFAVHPDRLLYDSLPVKIIQLVTLFTYIACGFFLKPVEKLSFLSVVFIAIILLIIFIVFLGQGGDSGFGHFTFNPVVAPFFSFNLPGFLYTVLVFLSPLFPSLLIYLGMVLRKLLKR